MEPKVLDKFVKLFKNGIEPEDLPMVLADVYQEVTKIRGLTTREITKRCEDTIYYIIDNTDAGKYDDEIDAVVRPMVPGMVAAFMSIRNGNFSFKKCCF